MIPFLDLYQQYLSIQPEIDEAIQEVIRDGAFINGKFNPLFEEEFAAYQQVQACVGVGNGTDALEIAIEGLELPPGEVIVPANTFIASSESITRAGHEVVFADCGENYTLSVENLKITPRTRALIAVHLYGHPADMDPILELSRQYGFKVIEDCAQAHGAEYKGKRVGGLGDVGAFSFYPGKNLGAYGDAGVIATNDPSLANRCRMIANHGRIKKYDHEFEGRNSRLDGLQAAILRVKLKYLEGWLEKRIQVAEQYRKGLAGLPLVLPKTEDWARHVFHLFVIRTKQRDALQSHLKEKGIQTGIHYPIALPKLKAYEYVKAKDVPNSNRWDSELLSLPMGDHLSPEQVETVIEAVREFFK